MSEVKAALNQKSAAVTKSMALQVKELVKQFLNDEQAELKNINTFVHKETKKPLNTMQLRERFCFYYSSKQYTEGQLKRAFDEVLDEQWTVRLLALKQELSFQPAKERAGKLELQRFLHTLLGHECSSLEFKVMYHFLWQVKRKLAGLPVTYHMMPIIVGPQGSGKSTAVKMLLSPLKHMILLGKSIDFVTEEKNYKALSDYYVCFFDEMAGMDRTDETALKLIITAENLVYRVYHSQQSCEIPQNCSFIATSNRYVIELIKDLSGTRRFFEFQAPKKLDFDAINSINYLLIWQCINPAYDSAFTFDVEREELFKEQTKNERQKAIVEWLAERKYYPVSPNKTSISGRIVRRLPKDLWADYKQYSAEVLDRKEIEYHHKVIFYRQLKEFGYHKIKTQGEEMYLLGQSGPAEEFPGAYLNIGGDEDDEQSRSVKQ